jgi:hypothetical protein
MMSQQDQEQARPVASTDDFVDGWVILCDGREIASLEYLYLSGSCRQYRVTLSGNVEESARLLEVLSDKSREPGRQFVYVSRRTGYRACDLDFLCRYQPEKGEAILRDQRLDLLPHVDRQNKTPMNWWQRVIGWLR